MIHNNDMNQHAKKVRGQAWYAAAEHLLPGTEQREYGFDMLLNAA